MWRIKFTLRELSLLVLAVCFMFGGFALGRRSGELEWRKSGYLEAQDHYRVILGCYAKEREAWRQLGELWREYPNTNIIADEPFGTLKRWQDYVFLSGLGDQWKFREIFESIEKGKPKNDRKT